MRRDVIGLAGAGIVVLAAGLATAAGWVDWPTLGRWLAPHAGLIVVFVVGALLLATACRRALRRAPRRQALSWWVVAGAGVLVVAAAWGATTWLLHEADRAQDPPAARVEAIKTGLGVAAGTAGVFALLLAVRRQWHQELSAADTTHDATERRVTELYTKAVEQLGSPQPAVRLGGLYALERVAQNNLDQRQTVVNVLCAYLRMPYTPPSTAPRRLDLRRPRRAQDARVPAPSAAREELEVRLAAQRILTKHLRPGREPTPVDTFWQEIDLDLTDATLVNWSLEVCRVHNATFNRARFSGDARFLDAQFTGDAKFDEAQFGGDAEFLRAKFGTFARFRGAHFIKEAMFNEAEFSSLAGFRIARFDDHARYHQTRFGGMAEFDAAQFTGYAEFVEARFTGHAEFYHAHFTDDADFHAAHFTSHAEFTGAQFGGEAEFDGARFARLAYFVMTQFTGSALFSQADFTREPKFEGARFEHGVPKEIAAFVDPVAPDDASG